MDVLQDTYSALTTSAITSLLADGVNSVYHGWSEDAGTYPIIIYGLSADVPGLSGDNAEEMHVVTVRIHIVTSDGAYSAIYAAVNKAMTARGYRRKFTQELNDEDMKILVVDYTITTEME